MTQNEPFIHELLLSTQKLEFTPSFSSNIAVIRKRNVVNLLGDNLII